MKTNQLLLATILLASSMASTASYAHDSENRRRNDRENEMNRVLRHKVKTYKPKPGQARTIKKPQTLTTIACGDVISQSITVANDLNCSDSGFALRIVGKNVVINGNGRKITAPNAAAGIYVDGDNNTIANFDVQGVTQGYGLMAYNASNVKILSNNFSNNMIGIMIYADNGETASPIIMNNKAMLNSFAGVRTYYDDLGTITNPVIKGNDFRLSGEFAIYVKANTYQILCDDNNKLSGSNNGYYLKDGVFKISNLDLSDQLIYKRHFFVDSAKSIVFDSLDVSTIAPLSPSQERMGIDLYKVAKFQLKNVKAKGHDVALKLETEGGVSTEGSLTDCYFSNQSLAGVYIVSYDSTAYGTIKFTNQKFSLLAGVGQIVIQSTTVVNIVQVKSKDKDRDCDDRQYDEDDRDNDRDDKDCDRKKRDQRDNNRAARDRNYNDRSDKDCNSDS